MSKISRFQELKNQLATMEAEVEMLRNDPKVQRAQECLGMVNELMAEYGMSIEDIVSLVRPGATVVMTGAAAPKARRERRTKVYTNPHSGEVVKTKGGNHNVLKAWRERWSSNVVEGWWVYED